MDVVALELAAEDLKVMTPFPEWSGVRYYHDDQELAFAGDNSGRVLEIDCPWATPAGKPSGADLSAIRRTQRNPAA